MARPLIVAGLVSALLLGSLPTADADAWMRWKDQSTQRYMEVVEVENPTPSLEHYVWQFGSSFASPGFLLDDQNKDFRGCQSSQQLRVVGGGTGAWQEGQPAVPIYVRVVAKVKNVGTREWLGFHFRPISGCSVYKLYGDWPRYWDMTSDENGWDFDMDPSWDPSWGPEYGPVYPNETFSCETWLKVTSPTGNFEIEMWPTPEPSAFLSLFIGSAGLASYVVRRRRVR